MIWTSSEYQSNTQYGVFIILYANVPDFAYDNKAINKNVFATRSF